MLIPKIKTSAYCEHCKQVQPIIAVINATLIFTPLDGVISIDRRVVDDVEIQCDICGKTDLRLDEAEIDAIERAARGAI